MNIKSLIGNISGELLDDDLNLAIYATDASMYQKKPSLVAIPKTEADLKKIIIEANRNKIPIAAKGSATSLAGQAVNTGIAIDFTKYFNKIIDINEKDGFAVVQPGATRDQLNIACAKYGLHFAPDPATSNRATFGGMIANNSSGTKSILYGMTSDHVIELKVMTVTGDIFYFKKLDQTAYDNKSNENSQEGNLYKRVRQLIFNNAEEIETKFPKTLRRVGGYALDAFTNSMDWNLANLIVGSEGTLALILEAKVKLTPLPKFQNMVIVHYDDRLQGIASVKNMIQFGPAAIEMLDYNVLQQSKVNNVTKKYYDSIIIGEPKAVMTVEFYGETSLEIETKANQLIAQLAQVKSSYAYPITNLKSKINDAIALRKEGLGLLMSKPGIRKPLAFVEDAAIPLEHLADYIEELENFCLSQGSEIVLYGHASVGVLHVRPAIDLRETAEVEKMKLISDFSFELVKKYGGSFSSEHGDGRVRSHKLKEFYGEKIFKAFEEIKHIFDPNGILNPNIIVNAKDMRNEIRYYDNYTDKSYPFEYKYRIGGTFYDHVHNCTGVGACRKDGGTMCPSFKATGAEAESTRGRANVLRLAISGQMTFEDLTDKSVKNILDLCLSCKACKSECPSNVDMAKLKSEVQQLHYSKYGISLKERLPLYASSISKILSGKSATFINAMLKLRPIKYLNYKILGIHKERNLPAFAKQSLVLWYKNQLNFKSQNKVVLFADTYINYHETDLGIHIIKLLNNCGIEVILADVGCCQRPKISNGFLKEAKKNLEPLALDLFGYIQQGLKIITVEPSCTTALIDDLPDLIEDEKIGLAIKDNVMPAETYFLELIKQNKIQGKLVAQHKDFIHHGHCHQKATYSTKAVNELLLLVGGNGKELDTGCCGMAGAFGYESNHFDISKTIAHQKLIPQINQNLDKAVIANGISCRHQITDFSDTKPMHVLQNLMWVKEY
jgi:FAD/FMN-containing dehydrogenase/Fe-S oxidoreductase